jgi:hypothetical protein
MPDTPDTPSDPEAATQEEIRKDAAVEPDDPQTAREELELDLMAADQSDVGEELGEQID